MKFPAHASWHDHVNGVNAPQNLRHWLTDTGSLTEKLVAHAQQFRVQRLHQWRGRCLSDECAQLGVAHRAQVWEREVLLRCDGVPVVFAHTVVPLQATASDWPLFGNLGERSLGSTLFGDPLVQRGSLQYARLHRDHPLMQRVRSAVDHDWDSMALYARRSLFRRKRSVLLVSEIFLPAITRLAPVKIPGQ